MEFLSSAIWIIFLIIAGIICWNIIGILFVLGYEIGVWCLRVIPSCLSGIVDAMLGFFIVFPVQIIIVLIEQIAFKLNFFEKDIKSKKRCAECAKWRQKEKGKDDWWVIYKKRIYCDFCKERVVPSEIQARVLSAGIPSRNPEAGSYSHWNMVAESNRREVNRLVELEFERGERELDESEYESPPQPRFVLILAFGLFEFILIFILILIKFNS